uniref:B box-type domain-containing protein n=1 Tax=Chenopodium quinoa TaxID=63459 RepID=A0A803N6V5_CHEQI
GYGKPAWLDALYTQNFFVNCPAHETAKKNEKNVLCLDCCTSLCPHCLTMHRFHRLIQIRRYVYHDVIRLEDLEKVIDCSNVQVDFVLTHNRDLSPYLRVCKVLQLSPDFLYPQDMGDDEMTNETPNSTIVDCDEPMSSYCGSSDSENMSVACTETEIVRKKRSGLYVCGRSINKVSDEDMATSMSRRKGIPHRSPLC